MNKKFSIGDFVKLVNAKDCGYVVDYSGNAYEVAIVYPYFKTFIFLEEELMLVPEIKYMDTCTGNYAIDHVKDNTKSIEQQYEEIFMDPFVEDSYMTGYYDVKIEQTDDEWTYKFTYPSDKQYKSFDEYQQETRLNAKELEDLHNLYIDLALQTDDEDWFKELTNKK